VYLATVEQLADTAERLGRLVAGIKPEQWSASTPCPDWDVQSLVTHLVNGNTLVAAALSGRAPTYQSLRADFDRSAETMIAAFAVPDALEKVVEVPFGRVPASIALHLRLTEFLAHGWDLARATGQSTDFADDLIEQEMSFTVGALADIPPDRTPFAPAQPVADDAPALDRLAARLGRKI
jgi:uncharacterized protein (TIGR03086 family)